MSVCCVSGSGDNHLWARLLFCDRLLIWKSIKATLTNTLWEVEVHPPEKVEMLAHVLWEAALISLSRRWTHLDWFLYSCSTEQRRIKTHIHRAGRDKDSFLITGRYLMMVCRPLTCGVLSNTLSVWGSGWFCWAEARSALRPKRDC